MTSIALHRRRASVVVPLVLVLMTAGCADPLEVDDPTAILDGETNSAQGAEQLWRGALSDFFTAVGYAALESGLLADEFLYQAPALWDLSSSLAPDEALDRRETVVHHQQTGYLASYEVLQGSRLRSTTVAIDKLKAYAPVGVRALRVGEMFAARGYATMRLAEDFCPGFPLHKVVDYNLIPGSPVSTQQAFEQALADFDSAATWAADSARILDFARVGRARTLLNLGRFADAASAAAPVPTTYQYQTHYGTIVANLLASEPGWNGWGVERSVADREGGNGLNFVSANDPRVPTIRRGTARDGVTGLYGYAKYVSRSTPIVLASGIEARLIEAEAALKNGDQSWLTTLNQLRATQVTPALAPLTDPGTPAARVDLLFRERAFWLFATGHRLADLQRLIRNYGRTPDSVFPSGTYWRGGNYGAGTNLPFNSVESSYSPGVTGCSGS